MVVDCHAHVAPELTGSRKPLRYGRVMHKGRTVQWLPPSFDPPASHPETLLAYMDEIGIAHAYLVQHYGWGDQNMAILRAVQQWPDRFTGFAFLPSIGRPDAADQLERLIDASMAGLKIELGLTRQMWPGFRLGRGNPRSDEGDVGDRLSDGAEIRYVPAAPRLCANPLCVLDGRPEDRRLRWGGTRFSWRA